MPAPSGDIEVERFGNCSEAICPAVLILSGSRGFGASAYDEIGQEFPATGLNAHLVHVLTQADLDVIAKADGARARISFYAERREDWMAGAGSVAAYLEGRPRHGGKVGVLGISLGAQIAAAASSGQTNIDALVLSMAASPTAITSR